MSGGRLLLRLIRLAGARGLSPFNMRERPSGEPFSRLHAKLRPRVCHRRRRHAFEFRFSNSRHIFFVRPALNALFCLASKAALCRECAATIKSIVCEDKGEVSYYKINFHSETMRGAQKQCSPK